MASSKRLTELADCAGCAAKIRPELLSRLLSQIDNVKAPQALVGFESSDDAAVFQLSSTVAIVETVDFFPPVVDDPYAYGQIAAANAMSDIWAMGAKALFALNVVAFPKAEPEATLRKILQGGADKAQEAGIPILGGHSIHSAEPKYGMAVTGQVHPKRILRNSGAKAGDLLVLTKPLGTGIATTAHKRKLASPALLKAAIAQMSALNVYAGQALAQRQCQVNAMTDVTGFGLLGHLFEMAAGSKLRATLQLERVPLLPGIAALAEAGVVPGGTHTNLAHVRRHLRLPRGLPLPIQLVLADAQTNGGLLAAVPPASMATALRLLSRAGVEGYVIGQFQKGKIGIDVV
jgi:selenide, water dikinase